LKISTLMENTPYADGFLYEHGLSLYIETGKHRILFDTGGSAKFADNAERLGIDLSQVDIAVLSHGHYDHSGGLKKFLLLNHTAPIYVSRYAFEPHYAGADREIGVDPELERHPQIVPVNESLTLDGGLELCACNDRPRPYHMGNYGLYAFRNGALEPDTFLHEQYLTVHEDGKKIVFSGCSHKGVLNIMHWLTPDVLVGGFHFMKVDPEGPEKAVLDEAAEVLLRYDAKYYTGHCTGIPPYRYLKAIMGDRLEYLASGQVIAI